MTTADVRSNFSTAATYIHSNTVTETVRTRAIRARLCTARLSTRYIRCQKTDIMQAITATTGLIPNTLMKTAAASIPLTAGTTIRVMRIRLT